MVDVVAPELVSVRVAGNPVPQGSHRVLPHPATGRPVVLDSAGAALVAWRTQVAWELRAAWRHREPHEGAVAVELEFALAAPQRPRGTWPRFRPDIDKLARGILDALTDSGVLADDSRVCELAARKSYGTPGVTITVRPLV